MSSLHAGGGKGGSGGAGNGNKTGENSGGMKLAHTSYSEPNCRRNRSENVRSKTKTGSKITVPIYGIAAMQQVAQVTKHATIAVAKARRMRNKQYKRTSPGCAAINLATMPKALAARQRCTYMTGTMKFAANDHARTKKISANTHATIADIR
jgi:hypothetical protein